MGPKTTLQQLTLVPAVQFKDGSYMGYMARRRDATVEFAAALVIGWQTISRLAREVCPFGRLKAKRRHKIVPLTAPLHKAGGQTGEGAALSRVWKDIVSAAAVSPGADLAHATAVRRLVRVGDGERVEMKLARRQGEQTDSRADEAVTAFFRFEDFAGPLGCAAIEQYGTDGLLRSVLLLGHRRGAGAGSEMVTQVMEAAEALGVERLWLLTETSQPFFAKLGFRRVDRRDLPRAITKSSEFRASAPNSTACMMIELPGLA